MRLTRLSLAQVRAFEQAEFLFQPGMNLLVGVNGAGKSTVLDALRILLSHALPQLTASRSRPEHFYARDIAKGKDWLYVNLQFLVSNIPLEYEMRLGSWRTTHEAADTSAGEPHDDEPFISRFRDIVADPELVKAIQDPAQRYSQLQALTKQLRASAKQLRAAEQLPLAVYFSTRRSVPSMLKPSKASSAGGKIAAFVNSMAHRELRIRELAEWWLVQEALAREGEALSRQRLAVLEGAVKMLLDGTIANVHAVGGSGVTLLLDKNGLTLDVRQLSDGERGILALVLDLARRLAQANPHLDNPLRDGRAVVLIDELDLHLHPRWQRMIVQKLTETFPSCQFIATTHSPLIIGEVASEQIILLEAGRQPYRPDQSLGMDSNWILQVLMGTSERNVEISEQLERISDLIEDGEYEQAAVEIAGMREGMPNDPELVRLQVRIDRLQMLGE